MGGGGLEGKDWSGVCVVLKSMLQVQGGQGPQGNRVEGRKGRREGGGGGREWRGWRSGRGGGIKNRQ